MQSLEVPDSPEWVDEPLTWEHILDLEEQRIVESEKQFSRQQSILRQLQPQTNEFSSLPFTSVRKTRTHAFCQRHVYTADLAEYLNLASRSELDHQSKLGRSDSEILYMLNRKYAKLRKFYEKHQLTRHRFKKKNFSIYLEDFKRYQAAKGRGGIFSYEAYEDSLSHSRDRKELERLQKLTLETVNTTEEEEEHSEPEQVSVRKQRKSQNSDDVSTRRVRSPPAQTVRDSSLEVVDSDDDKENAQTLRPGKENQAIRITSATPNPVDELSDDSDSVFHTRGNRISHVVESLDSDDVQPAPLTPDTTNDPIFDDPTTETQNLIAQSTDDPAFLPLGSRRTRKHKFSQDHVYVTDTAVHLGLSTVYYLNDLYDNGNSYEQIIDYLEIVYSRKREERERRDIGYGPYFKPTFRALLEGETRKIIESSIGEKHKQTDERAADHHLLSSDEEYVLADQEEQESQEDVLSSQPEYHNIPNRPVLGEPFLPKTKESSRDRSESPEDQEAEDAEVHFRNRVMKKRKALKGVLPNSFFAVNSRLNGNNSFSPQSTRKSIDKPGLARKKKMTKQVIDQDKFDDFLAPDEGINSGEEIDHIGFHNFSDSSAGALEVEEISLLSSAEDDSDFEQLEILDHSGLSNELDDQAMEDRSTGINYMLNTSERRSKKRPRTRAPTTSSRYKRPNRPKLAARVAHNGRFEPSNTYRSSSAHTADQHPNMRDNETLLMTEDEEVEQVPIYDVDKMSDSEPSERFKSPMRLTATENDFHSTPIQQRSYFGSGKSARSSIPGARKQSHGRESAHGGTTRGSRTHSPAIPRSTRKPLPDKGQRSITGYMSGSLRTDPRFYYGRDRIVGTAQLESTKSTMPATPRKQDPIISSVAQLSSPSSTISTYEKAIDKLEKSALGAEVQNLDHLSAASFKGLELKPSSIVYSTLFLECLNEDGHYFRSGEILFDFGTIRFTLSESNIESSTRLIETLMKVIIYSLRKPGDLNMDQHIKLRKIHIRLVQLTWNLEKLNRNELARFAKMFLLTTKSFLDNKLNDKITLLYASYHLLILNLLDKFSHRQKDENLRLNYEAIVIRLEKSIVTSSCRLSPSQFYKCMKGKDYVSAYYLDSMSMFTTLCKNPWGYMASLAKDYKFPFENVVNFLFFLNSRHRVLVDWEYFINEIDQLQSSGDHTKWKLVLRTVMKIVLDLGWNFEEHLLIKIYRLLSSHRFENIGSAKHYSPWLYSIPKSVDIIETDGCLDIYFKFLTLYVQEYMEPKNQVSLIEKLIPIGDMKTSTLSVLLNRINILLIMSMLFKRDFGAHFASVLKVLLGFKNLESYKCVLEILLVISRCYMREFKKVPFGLIRGCLPKVINTVNSTVLGLDPIAEKLRDLVDYLEHCSLKNFADHSTTEHYLNIFSIILRLRNCDSEQGILSVMIKTVRTLQAVLFKTPKSTVSALESKLKMEVVTSLKSVILAAEIKNEVLRSQCVFCWIHISSMLQVNLEALIHLEWIYFGDETIRSQLELTFYSAVLTYYHHQLTKNICEDVLSVFMRNLPVMVNPPFYKFFQLVSKHEAFREYFVFRNGKDPSRFSLYEFNQLKQRITIKVLAKIIVSIKKGEKSFEFESILNSFVESVGREYWKQKELYTYPKFKEYAINAIRYLNTVASSQVSSNTTFLSLKHELSIDNVKAPLIERFETLSNVEDVVMLLEVEYILSLVNHTLVDFEEELIECIFEVSTTESDPMRTSVLYPLVLLISLHSQAVSVDMSHWLHLENWLATLTKCLALKGALSKSDIWCLIKLLTLMAPLGSAKSARFALHINHCVELVYNIVSLLNFSLIGFEDRADFLESIPLLVSVGARTDDECAITCSFEKLSSADLSSQFQKLYSDYREVLERAIAPNDNSKSVQESKETLEEKCNYNMELIYYGDGNGIRNTYELASDMGLSFDVNYLH